MYYIKNNYDNYAVNQSKAILGVKNTVCFRAIFISSRKLTQIIETLRKLKEFCLLKQD